MEIVILCLSIVCIFSVYILASEKRHTKESKLKIHTTRLLLEKRLTMFEVAVDQTMVHEDIKFKMFLKKVVQEYTNILCDSITGEALPRYSTEMKDDNINQQDTVT